MALFIGPPCTLCKNFVNFDPVTPELTGLICELMMRHGKNRRIQSNISGYTGPIFAIFSPYESALGARDRSEPRFPISQGTLPWQPILDEIRKMTFIRQDGVTKRIGIWQF